jgi:hypothetical protein
MAYFFEIMIINFNYFKNFMLDFNEIINFIIITIDQKSSFYVDYQNFMFMEE